MAPSGPSRTSGSSPASASAFVPASVSSSASKSVTASAFPSAPVTPFEPISTAVLPRGEQWIAQIKWDGVRMLTYYDGERIRLVNRKHNDRTAQYPEFHDPSSYCTADSFIIDGEIIALENGKPSFHEVMRRDGARKQQRIVTAQQQVPVVYMVFDLLFLNGQWVTDRPLVERQRLLSSIIRPTDTVQTVANFSDMNELYRVVELHELEGIVCKDLQSPYAIGGKDRRWQKKKTYQDLVAVIGGVTRRAGTVNALLLGLYGEDGRLHYIGHAGTGKWTVADWRSMTEAAERLRAPRSPFHIVPPAVRGREAEWLEPSLTVKIRFLEWTAGGTLRQPSIQALVQIPPHECRLDPGGS